MLGQPGDGGGCSSGCSVGGHGTGGENSGGNAKGFNDKGLTFPEHPGEVVSNSGTDFSGHLMATGPVNLSNPREIFAGSGP